jgi:hypothetical protein
MTPRHWFAAGWIFIIAAAALAVVAAVLALNAVSGHNAQVFVGSPGITFAAGQDSFRLLLGVVLAVLAGVAFFSGIACFFWGAMLDGRQRMAQILQSARAPGHGGQQPPVQEPAADIEPPG